MSLVYQNQEVAERDMLEVYQIFAKKLRSLAYVVKNKDIRSRLNLYVDRIPVDKILYPDLDGYSDLLSDVGYNDTYIRNHCSSVRSVYYDLLSDRDWLYKELLPALIPNFNNRDMANRKALVDEIIIRIKTCLDIKIFPKTIQDKPDEGIWLTKEELGKWVSLPDTHTTGKLRRARDKAIFSLMASTGIREAELVQATVSDVFQTYGGHPAMRVRRGKGNKQRMIPYPINNSPLPVIEDWLSLSGIENKVGLGDLALFVAITKGDTISSNENHLSTRSVERLFKRYSKFFGRRLRPHDLRRTYARSLYDSNVDVLVIKANLGHSQIETTLGYLGNINAAERLPPDIF